MEIFVKDAVVWSNARHVNRLSGNTVRSHKCHRPNGVDDAPVMLETNGIKASSFSSPRCGQRRGFCLLTKPGSDGSGAHLTGVGKSWCTARGSAPTAGNRMNPSGFRVLRQGHLVDLAQQAKDVIGAVTRTALAKAPGMTSPGLIPLPAPSNPQDSGDRLRHRECAWRNPRRSRPPRPPTPARRCATSSQLPFSLAPRTPPCPPPRPSTPGRGQGRSPGCCRWPRVSV